MNKKVETSVPSGPREAIDWAIQRVRETGEMMHVNGINIYLAEKDRTLLPWVIVTVLATVGMCIFIVLVGPG